MSTALRKGELVILQHATYFTEYDGCLGVVETGLHQAAAMDMRVMEYIERSVYSVKILHSKCNHTVVAMPHQLRRLEEGSDVQSREQLKRKPKPVEEVCDD